MLSISIRTLTLTHLNKLHTRDKCGISVRKRSCEREVARTEAAAAGGARNTEQRQSDPH
jgi:hypothetical protein